MGIEDGAAEIARQRRAKLRNVRWQTCVVLRQRRKTVWRCLVVRVEEFLATLLAALAGAERPDERAQNREAGDPCEAGQHFARQAHHLWALGPEAKAGRGLVVVALLRLVVAHRGLPSVRTMRTFCCLSPPRRSSAAAKSRSTM